MSSPSGPRSLSAGLLNPTALDPTALDPELRAELTRKAKQVIRARKRAVRQQHPRAVLDQKSEALCARLEVLPGLLSSRGVALYWPLVERGEVDLRPLDRVLRARGVALYYPVMERTERGYSTGFRQSLVDGDVRARGGKFAEPDPSAPLAARGDVDWVIVPALAADMRGHRIGYGAGYYDATLPDVCPPAKSAIVVYDFQLEGEIPNEPHDQAADFVVTDKRTFEASKS